MSTVDTTFEAEYILEIDEVYAALEAMQLHISRMDQYGEDEDGCESLKSLINSVGDMIIRVVTSIQSNLKRIIVMRPTESHFATYYTSHKMSIDTQNKKFADKYSQYSTMFIPSPSGMISPYIKVTENIKKLMTNMDVSGNVGNIVADMKKLNRDIDKDGDVSINFKSYSSFEWVLKNLPVLKKQYEKDVRSLYAKDARQSTKDLPVKQLLPNGRDLEDMTKLMMSCQPIMLSIVPMSKVWNEGAYAESKKTCDIIERRRDEQGISKYRKSDIKQIATCYHALYEFIILWSTGCWTELAKIEHNFILAHRKISKYTVK